MVAAVPEVTRIAYVDSEVVAGEPTKICCSMLLRKNWIPRKHISIGQYRIAKTIK